jgi:hypothetical protein
MKRGTEAPRRIALHDSRKAAGESGICVLVSCRAIAATQGSPVSVQAKRPQCEEHLRPLETSRRALCKMLTGRWLGLRRSRISDR